MNTDADVSDRLGDAYRIVREGVSTVGEEALGALQSAGTRLVSPDEWEAALATKPGERWRGAASTPHQVEVNRVVHVATSLHRTISDFLKSAPQTGDYGLAYGLRENVDAALHQIEKFLGPFVLDWFREQTSPDTDGHLERLGVFEAQAAIAEHLLKSVPAASREERPLIGRAGNALKRLSTGLALLEKDLFEEASRNAHGREQRFDATLPAAALEHGSLHPITQVTRELEDLFTSMGWTVLDGPEVETEFYNFDALNIAGDHPARDTMDTFWVNTAPKAPKLVLRTHTSPVQVRAMQRLKPPFRAIVPGKVFRNEAVDASHEHTFHQMEGLVVGKDISVGHLIGSMKTLLRGIFGRDIEIRLRPGYFPFVEPGFELDARCPFCTDGCSVCKRSTWIELLPCGMVHPNVLRSGGIDPEQWTGFAFGLGLSRLVMLRFGIDDVRHLLGGDLRFLEQF